MKTMKFFGKVFGLAAIIMLIGACNLPFGDDESEMENSGIDYTDYQTSAAFFVRNSTSQNLVAFKGTLDESMNLGGIPGHAENHGINKNSAIFQGNTEFPMILITEADYLANKGNLQSLKEKPFTRVYVFYNANGENNVVYDISDRLGGQFKLTIQNPTNFNVELRLGGTAGETIGYAPAGMLTTTLYVNEGDMNIFPVFKRYNVVRDIVDTMIPKMSNGYAWFEPLGFEDVPGSRDQTFNVKNAVDQLSSKTLGVAWLAIENRSLSGAVHLMKGTEVVRSSTGVSYFTGNRTFQIDMPTLDAGASYVYQDYTTISNFTIGPDAWEVPITIEGLTGEEARNIRLYTDKMYTVVVTGSFRDESLKAVIYLDDAKDVELW